MATTLVVGGTGKTGRRVAQRRLRRAARALPPGPRSPVVQPGRGYSRSLISQPHPRAVPAASVTTAAVPGPVDVDAAVDAPTRLTALHEQVERQFAAYQATEPR